ncbi:helix-turn-helix domain-containing protein [Sphingobacterium oryzagri]|uniref:Helix-turn-helix domain-containing protein n=1 Tax=Sphingobacterium oryzagri TaxID=3025669 RepID=A0ABY7WAZ1_9SPHI|nr:helix-turn-helix domain-containing protein [Sphingobacterium sp. KACC 22765]WDF66831.1 helix-turn-helix domain-containing protein [Sphingobacterium sp. KACC 22765]
MRGINLFFGTPHIPYSWENIDKINSYSCLFTEEFLKTNNNSESLQQSPLFKIGGTPIFTLTEEMAQPIIDIMHKMIDTYSSTYVYKDDLARNYINLIIHEALQWEPAQHYSQQSNAAARTTALFMDLLERQFPIESPDRPLQLRTANDFSERLSIHMNHLNRSIKEHTGKSTSAHIAERMVIEAKALLKHTTWSVSEIAFSLGFEYPTYFNNHFKKHTGISPSAFRSLNFPERNQH